MSKQTFFLGVIVVVLTILGFGFVLPALVSAKNDVTPVIGFSLIGLIFAVVVYLAIDKLGFFTKRKENKE